MRDIKRQRVDCLSISHRKVLLEEIEERALYEPKHTFKKASLADVNETESFTRPSLQ